MASNCVLRIGSKIVKNRLFFSQNWSKRGVNSLSFSETLSLQNCSQSELSNGVRVVTETTPSPTTTVGVWVDAGTRYECPRTSGVSNLVSRLVVRGSESWPLTRLETELGALGAVLETKAGAENICFYIKCLSRDVSRAVEILAEIIKNAKICEKDLENERNQVLKAIKESVKDCELVVMETLHATAFQQTPLALSLTGPTENVRHLTRSDCLAFVNTHFRAAKMVVSCVGGVEHNEIVKLANDSFGSVKQTFDQSEVPLMTSCRFTGSDVRIRDDAMPMCHVAIAVEGAGIESNDYVPLLLASKLVGQWDKSHGGLNNCSSNVAVAAATEGLCNSFKSFNVGYSGTGLWGIYFVSERMKLEDFLWQIQTEWRRLCTEVTNNELNRAKHVLLTQLCARAEDQCAVAEDMGSQTLSVGGLRSLAEWEDLIWSVDARKVRDVCAHYLWDRCPAVSALGPVENLPLYEELRSQMYWIRY